MNNEEEMCVCVCVCVCESVWVCVCVCELSYAFDFIIIILSTLFNFSFLIGKAFSSLPIHDVSWNENLHHAFPFLLKFPLNWSF